MNFNLRLVVLFISFLLLSNLDSIAQADHGYRSDSNSPEWILEMYKANADPGKVIDLYNSYYKENQFVKNSHTQYFKRWIKEHMRNAMPNASSVNQYWNDNQSNYVEKTALLAEHKGGNSNWVSIGPFDFDLEAEDKSYAAGAAHVYTVEQSISNPDVLYCGTANAGVWKSTNKGVDWTPCTKNMLIKRVYSLEIDYQNPDRVLFGGNDGKLYETTDGGTNWNSIGDVAFTALDHEMRDILFHPSNSQIVLIASDLGLYRSNDGGNNFTQILSGEVQEIEFHSTNPSIVYAVRRLNNKTQFFKSTDTALSFTLFTSGWPNPTAGQEQERTEIAVSPDAPNKVYALATGVANFGTGLFGIYISDDAGETWAFSCCGPQPGGQPSLTNLNLMGWSDEGLDDGGQYYYDLAFDVSPTNADSVFVGGVNLWVSGDGGSTFVCPAKWSHSYKPNYVHADIHDIRFFGNDLWVANDGGIFHSIDAGNNFERKMKGIEGTDFWGFGAGFWDGEVMLGGTYHNGTLLKDNDVFVNGWISTDGGDNTRGFVNPGSDKTVYSDYNRKLLSGDRTIAAATFPYGKKPNADGPGRESEIVFDPDCYTCFYTGFEESLWYTTDNGSSYELVKEFDNLVGEIEIPWSNTNIIYLSTYESFYGEKTLWKSIDKGLSWTDITPDNNVFNTYTNRPYVLAVNNNNPDEIFIARVGYFESLDGEKIFRSNNGGGTWQNITTTQLDGEMITNIVMQQGTNGGIWIGTRRTVYYKNNDMVDWQLYNVDLPAASYSTRLVPYYRKSMIRNATDRSVYEVDCIEQSQIKAQISVNTKSVACTSDTVYYADHSIMNEQGASWSWLFQGGTPANSSERQPKVMYDTPGTYTVSLTVTDNTGTDNQTYTDFVTVGNGCAADTVPGLAASLSTSGDYLNIPALDLSTNTISFSAWIKPSEVLNAYSGIVIGGDGSTGGLNLRDNMELAYHWPGGEWWWESGLFVPVGEWSHVAMVVNPNGITLYLNGVGSTHSVTTTPVDFTNNTYIGSYKEWTDRNFFGEIDEVCIWNTALTQNAVREQMHLTKLPDNDANLLAYYQFNNTDGNATDRAAGRHASFAGNALRVSSNAPVGGGLSDRLNVVSTGVTSFPNTGTVIDFAGPTLPNGEIVVSRLGIDPNILPSTNPSSESYWIINNYGINSSFDVPNSIVFDGHKYVSNADAASPDSFFVYNRPFNAFTNIWDSLGNATIATAGTPGSVGFESFDSWSSGGQFVIMNKGLTIDSIPNRIIDINQVRNIAVYPNPISKGNQIVIASDISYELTFILYDINGRTVLEKNLVQKGAIEMSELPTGNYFYRILVDKYMTHGKLLIH